MNNLQPMPGSNPVETVYLIRNGDLHKIGITSDFDRRMRELQPDHVQARLDLDGTENFTAADIERTPEQELGIEYFKRRTAELQAEQEAASSDAELELIAMKGQALRAELEVWKQRHLRD